MEWYVRAEMTGTLNDEQQETLADGEGITLVHVNDATGTAAVSVTIESGRADALSVARRALARLGGMQALIAGGVLSQPYRIVVESADAATADMPLVSTQGFAGLLGVSAPRIRELANQGRPGFPKPLTIPGAAGTYFSRAAVEAYLPTHRGGPGGAH